MFKNISHRLMFVPLIALVGFIVAYGAVEFKKISGDGMVRRIINDPLPVYIHDMQLSAYQLKGVYEKYHPASAMRPETPQPLRAALDDLIERKRILSEFMYKDAFETEEHIGDLVYLRHIESLIHDINQNFISFQCRDEVIWTESQKKLDALIEQTHKLRSSIYETHKAGASHILGQVVTDERHRALLLIYVLIGAIVLVIVLVDSLYRYKRNAERASAAEKCNALFAAALQNTHVGVLIRDMRRAERPIVFINAAFTRMTGYAFADIQGDSSDFLFGWKTDQKAVAAFRRAVNLQETTVLEALLYRKDGSPFWGEWHMTPLMGDDGRLAYFVSLLNDTTAQRQTQEDLIQAKATAEHASAVKSSFLAMMSHEIRTPINGILGVFKLLDGSKLDAEQKYLLGIAKTSGTVLNGIINDILDYAKMEAGKIEIVTEPFEPRVLMDELIGLGRSLLGEKSIILDCEVAESVPERMVGDVGRLRQILLNLISNAIKFTETGSIHVRAFSLLQQEVDGKDGHLMRFEVQDTGLGISGEDQAKLFFEFSQVERNFARRFGGTGLGLAICRRLIGLMNGEINVESQTGKGSRFWFILPLQTAGGTENGVVPNGAGNAKPTPSRHIASLRVLLVEDNEINRLVAHRYVEKMGIQVDEACNGQEAIEKASAVGYDLILMDISMPVMDGIMATKHIRALDEHNATVPIVALTAHAMEGDRLLCLSAGMNDYLQKPINVELLVKIFERWLNIRVSESLSGGWITTTSQPEQTTQPVSCSFGSDVPVFSANVLRSMRDELGPDVVGQVTRVFLNDSAKRVDSFSRSENIEDIRDIAHTLKSCSANCGLMRFSALMAEIERSASRKQLDKVDSLMQYISSTYQEASQTLEKERELFMN